MVIQQTLLEPQASLLSGILLGIEAGLPVHVQEDFRVTGTSPIIAIRGQIPAIFLIRLSQKMSSCVSGVDGISLKIRRLIFSCYLQLAYPYAYSTGDSVALDQAALDVRRNSNAESAIRDT